MTFYCLCCGNFFTEEEGLEAAKEYDGAYGERICPMCTADTSVHLTMQELEELREQERSR